MKLRESLVEKLLRLGIRRRDREMDVFGPLPGHEVGRKRGSSSARRRDAEIGLSFRLSENSHSEESASKQLRHGDHFTSEINAINTGSRMKKYADI
jgi:hypothetical protein